jgi:cbb3-type cytochrome c oxidase subunit III
MTARLALVLACLGLGGCRQDMHDQLKLEPLERSTFFADGRGSRSPVEGTIARGQLMLDRHLYEGRRPAEGDETEDDEGIVVEEFPFEVGREVLLRGRERFDIYCSPCHARTGNGDGMVVRRGFRKPPSLHEERLRKAKVGHLYDVIRRGIGAMPAYASQIHVRDRWAIVAYVRALQSAGNVQMTCPAGDVCIERKQLEPADQKALDAARGGKP